MLLHIYEKRPRFSVCHYETVWVHIEILFELTQESPAVVKDPRVSPYKDLVNLCSYPASVAASSSEVQLGSLSTMNLQSLVFWVLKTQKEQFVSLETNGYFKITV